jgi:hypothetical protein
MPDARRWQLVAYLRSINTAAEPAGPTKPQGEQR